jgi:hypothetical protein
MPPRNPNPKGGSTAFFTLLSSLAATKSVPGAAKNTKPVGETVGITHSSTSAIWSGEVDAPIVQDANYRFDDKDRAYIDSQIRGTQYLALAAYAGSGIDWVRLSFTDNGATLQVSGAIQPVALDQSDGQGTYYLPIVPVDAQVIEIKDPVTGGSWGTNPPIINGNGNLVENPNNSGTYGVTATAIRQNGGSWKLRFGEIEGKWFNV